jgi:TRAP-type uncharacterized transport system substrate-binding protein
MVGLSRRASVVTIFAVAAFLAAAALLWLAVGLLRPFPPHRVVMATGLPGSDYPEVGARYRAILARSDIDLVLVPTSGAIDNLARLRDPGAGIDVAILQGGTTTPDESPDLVSLGTVFYEPLWLFVPESFNGKSVEALRGRRVSIGPEGSGAHALSLKLLAKIGVTPEFANLLGYPPEEAAAKLLAGEIDGAAMMEAWDSPVVKRLLASPKVKVASFPRADAYVEIFPYLSKLVLPAGAGDIERNLPPTDSVLLAPKGCLVVRRELHPAIQYLLLQAATEVHSVPGIFRRPGQFPAPEAIDLPLSDEAVLYYKRGRPFLQRYLPFWLAVFVERLLVLLIPVAGILYPVVALLPPLRTWEVRRRILKLYGELRSLEELMDEGPGEGRAEKIAKRLADLEQAAARLKVPMYYADQIYTLKQHIAMVRERAFRMGAFEESAPADT